MSRRRGLLLITFVILACRQPAEQREDLPQAKVEPTPAAPAPAEPTAAEPTAAESTPPSESCNELERLTAIACAHVNPEKCESGSCSCKIIREQLGELDPCKPRGFARLRVENEARSIYLRDGAIWVGSDPLLDFNTIEGVVALDDPEARLFGFEEHQSFNDDYGAYELWAVAQMLCAVIDEQPRCSKPIMQNYVLSDSTEDWHESPISLEYAVRLEFTETGLRVAVERDADRERAQKEAPTARLFRAGEYSYAEVVDRPLKRL